MPIRPRYLDPFSPVLTSSVPLVVTDEQKHLVREVLDVACADSKFADKAYNAIHHILTSMSVVPPVIDSLSPGSATIGEPAFDMEVHGSGFTEESVIYFNGLEEPTVFVSPTVIKTGINMPLWLAPVVVPVHVVSKEGIVSNAVNFVFQESVPLSLSVSSKSSKTEKK